MAVIDKMSLDLDCTKFCTLILLLCSLSETFSFIKFFLLLPLVLGFNKIPLYGVLILTFGGALIFALLVRFVAVPWLRKRICQEKSDSEEPMVQYSPSAPEQKEKVAESFALECDADKSETVINFNDESGS